MTIREAVKEMLKEIIPLLVAKSIELKYYSKNYSQLLVNFFFDEIKSNLKKRLNYCPIIHSNMGNIYTDEYGLLIYLEILPQQYGTSDEERNLLQIINEEIDNLDFNFKQLKSEVEINRILNKIENYK